MIWYDDLYLSENIEKKADKIKWKITHNAGMLHMYVISLPQNNDSLLEIISTKELMQRYYPKKNLVIVGIAKGYEEAVTMAATIVVETMNSLGSTNVKQYLKEKRKEIYIKDHRDHPWNPACDLACISAIDRISSDLLPGRG